MPPTTIGVAASKTLEMDLILIGTSLDSYHPRDFHFGVPRLGTPSGQSRGHSSRSALEGLSNVAHLHNHGVEELATDLAIPAEYERITGRSPRPERAKRVEGSAPPQKRHHVRDILRRERQLRCAHHQRLLHPLP